MGNRCSFAYKFPFRKYNQLPLYRSRRDLYYLFDITEFRYKGSYINGLEVLGGNLFCYIRVGYRGS